VRELLGDRAVDIVVDPFGGTERRNLAGPLDLTSEPGQELWISPPLSPDHLDRDPPTALVVSEVDRAHAAYAESSDQCETAEVVRIIRVEAS
jgi:hypothetical protein